MGRQCEVSGKKTSFGNHVTTRGKAKYLGGVGKKTTGISRRTFKPNLQRIHVWLPNGTTRYVQVATSVIRTGMLTLEVDGKIQTFPLIKASRGSRKAREELKKMYPI
ncbi:MAG TPA: 50S ribosomal protein L28 [Isosphaeraceae bacterium]|jgi:large subunit ribosomal protein L28|nr:50S ribosomal protein L28 [Isosphaeraceae bacterium]